MTLLRAQELLLKSENLLDESESEISKLKSLLKQAQGFLPYDKTALYKEINEALLHQNIDESLPIVKEEINSYIKSLI
jgi:hypothetical protein